MIDFGSSPGPGPGPGLGICLLDLISLISLLNRRALAVGIAVCGTGVGTLVLPPLVEWAILRWVTWVSVGHKEPHIFCPQMGLAWSSSGARNPLPWLDRLWRGHVPSS